MESLKNNKMIAEFEGYKINYGFKKTGVLMLEQHISEEKLAYHSSWDWLMPVVEKIDQILPDDNLVSITYNRCLVEYFQEGITIEGLGNTRIEATYKAVVEFIKWYNENKQ